jgi:O-antigen/teichoic acid export membrane protein
MIYTRLDLLMLGAWQGEAVAGWYGAASRLYEAVHLLPGSLLDALFPEMARRHRVSGGRSWLRKFLARASVSLGATGLAVAVVGVVTGNWVLRLLYGSAVAPETLEVWFILVWAIPPVFWFLLGGHGLYVMGEQRSVTWLMVAAAAANVLLNGVLIPAFSYRGAAAAVLVTQWMLGLLLLGRALKRAGRPGMEAENASHG